LCFPSTPRLQLPALADQNVLVDVLHHDVLLAAA